MKKRILSALLTLSLALTLWVTPAFAAETATGEEKPLFPTVNTYTEGWYQDVPEGAWYAAAAKTCYEAGLITGTAANTFSPDASVSVSEAATLAARILAAIKGELIPPMKEGEAWYQRNVDFLIKNGVAVPENYTLPATRAQLFQLLAPVVPPEQLPAINSIETLPDTQSADVLRFYNAGILTGTDDYGTFQGNRGLQRSEFAAMAARIIDPSLRQTFTPKVKEEPPALSYEEELMQTEAFRINGVSVKFQAYLDVLNACVYETDTSLKSRTGTGLDWNAKYSGVDDLPQYFKDMAAERLVESTLIAAQARALGCTEEALPALLTPDPSKDLDKIYCAKHILVSEEQAANAILAALKANPSLETFDKLLTQYGTDPGMKADPRGYIFTDGDMVEEFEAAVKALKPGNCSTTPVKSSFGYHVILRLDPTTREGWAQAWQERKYEDYVEAWMDSATVTPNTAELKKLDVPARYQEYLASLNK